MTSARAHVSARLLAWAGTVALALALGLPEVAPLIDVGPSTLPLAAAAGLALFAVCAAGRWTGRREPARAPFLPASLYLTLRSAYEEVLWRGMALGALVPAVGGAQALALTSVGFAASHVPSQGRRAAVHLVTGAGFGTAYLVTGRLAAAIAAHAAYNVAVLAAVRIASRPFGPIAARTVRSYDRCRRHTEAERLSDDGSRETTVDAVVELRGVSKRFGPVEALRAVDLRLEAGEVLALLGPNGAGKTTALATMLGLRSPDSGTARLFGRDPRHPEARVLVGSTPQEAQFPPTLRVVEIVELVRAHFPAPLSTRQVLERFELGAIARRQAGGLSGGQRRRLAAALAFTGRPRAVLLDEPTVGLDVESRRMLWAEIRRFAESGGSVLLTTHQLDEVDALASSLAIIHNGAILTRGTPDELRARLGRACVRVRSAAAPLVEGAVRVARDGDAWAVHVSDADAAVRSLIASGFSFGQLEITPVSLEDAFLALTAMDGRA